MYIGLESGEQLWFPIKEKRRRRKALVNIDDDDVEQKGDNSLSFHSYIFPSLYLSLSLESLFSFIITFFSSLPSWHRNSILFEHIFKLFSFLIFVLLSMHVAMYSAQLRRWFETGERKGRRKENLHNFLYFFFLIVTQNFKEKFFFVVARKKKGKSSLARSNFICVHPAHTITTQEKIK